MSYASTLLTPYRLTVSPTNSLSLDSGFEMSQLYMARIRSSYSMYACGYFSFSSVSEVKRSVCTISVMAGKDIKNTSLPQR